MNMYINPILKKVLKILDKYLLMEGMNEIMISKEKNLELLVNGEIVYQNEERLDNSTLNAFLVQLANVRGQLFDKNNVELATSIPMSRIRVYALHSSVLIEQDFQINIRIPSTKIFDLESFEFDDDELNVKLSKTEVNEEFKLDKNLKFSKEQIISLVQSHKNILVCGGTNSGKTALINTLLSFVDKKERIVTVEDSPELHIENESMTRLLVQKGSDSKYSYVDAINSMNRLNPTRVILGELDTYNTLAYLRMSNTGHKGSITSLHTNQGSNENIEDTLNAIRLNALLQENIEEDTIDNLFKSAVDYIIYISPMSTTRKKIITDVVDLKQYFRKKEEFLK